MMRSQHTSPVARGTLLLVLAVCATSLLGSSDHHWDARKLAPEGRIDALCRIGDGLILAASRQLVPGLIYRSTDNGDSWEVVAQINEEEPIGNNITALAASPSLDRAWALTGNGRLWRTEDEGLTWHGIADPPPSQGFGPFQRTYGLVCLPSGTLLVSDTDPEGGRIHRSQDSGDTWHTVGRVSASPLYRFQIVGDGVLVNGWSGRVYKSTDDGLTWRRGARLVEGPLYATAYLGDGIVLQGAESGALLRSTDNGDTWSMQQFTHDAADDLAHVADGVVLFSTYTGDREIYRSLDWGLSWEPIWPPPTDSQGDWLDHVISSSHDGSRTAVGGTGYGWIVRYHHHGIDTPPSRAHPP